MCKISIFCFKCAKKVHFFLHHDLLSGVVATEKWRHPSAVEASV